MYPFSYHCTNAGANHGSNTFANTIAHTRRLPARHIPVGRRR